MPYLPRLKDKVELAVRYIHIINTYLDIADVTNLATLG